MYEWIGLNKENVEYYAYFEFDGPIGNSALRGSSFPLASARFLELFSIDPPAIDPPPPPPPLASPPESEPEPLERETASVDSTSPDQPIPAIHHVRHA